MVDEREYVRQAKKKREVSLGSSCSFRVVNEVVGQIIHFTRAANSVGSQGKMFLWSCSKVLFQQKCTCCLTINTNLAITISVTSLEESLCLGIGQSSGRGREILQEQPGEEEHPELREDIAP